MSDKYKEVTRTKNSHNIGGYIDRDNIDDGVSASIQVSGSVDTSTPGNFPLTYTVSDAADNSAVATLTEDGGGTFTELSFDDFKLTFRTRFYNFFRRR